MLPSKVLNGGDKKSLPDNEQDTQPPPPPYSEYSNSNYSGYSGGHHERTPTAPPASLINDHLVSPSSVIYPMPSPQPSSPSYPHPSSPTYPHPSSSPSPFNNSYGSVSHPVRHVPDADDHTNPNYTPPMGTLPSQQQPLLPHSSPPQTPWKKLQGTLSNYKKKGNQVFEDIKKKWCRKWTWYLVALLVFFLIVIMIDGGDSKRTPTFPGKIRRSTLMISSPYPLSPSYTEYQNPEDMAHLPMSELASLRIDFTTHSGELHIVSTEDPVSWLTFTSQKRWDDKPFQLETTFTHSIDNKSLEVTINNDHKSGQLVSVLHVARQDRQQGKLLVEVGDMTVYMMSQEPDEMIQDIDITLKGSTEGIKLPSSGTGWKGRHMRLTWLQSGTTTFIVPRLEASGTIELDVTAGGDLQLDQSITAKKLIKLRTKNGSIVTQSGVIVEADNIDFATSNDKLVVNGLQPRRSCSLRSNNGRIEATIQATADDSLLESLRLETDNAAIHLVTMSSQIKNAALITNLGSITMHATRSYEGLFDVQSSLGRSSVEDPEHKVKFDVFAKTIKQGQRVSPKDRQITLYSFAGSSQLVFDK